VVIPVFPFWKKVPEKFPGRPEYSALEILRVTKISNGLFGYWSGHLLKVLNRVTKIEIFEQPVKSGFDQLIRVENDNRSSANVKGEYVTIPRKFKIEVVCNKAF